MMPCGDGHEQNGDNHQRNDDPTSHAEPLTNPQISLPSSVMKQFEGMLGLRAWYAQVPNTNASRSTTVSTPAIIQRLIMRRTDRSRPIRLLESKPTSRNRPRKLV